MTIVHNKNLKIFLQRIGTQIVAKLLTVQTDFTILNTDLENASPQINATKKIFQKFSDFLVVGLPLKSPVKRI